MWYIWTSVFCFQLAVGNASFQQSAGLATSNSDAAAVQQQAPPEPPPAEEKPQAGPKTGPRYRVEGSQLVPVTEDQEQKEIKLPTGPMRIELVSVGEQRIRYVGQPPEKPITPAIHLHVRMTGGRLAEMVGLGPLVIEEMIDDSGAVLASPDELKGRDRSATSPVKITRGILERGYVDRTGQARAPSRAARKIVKVSGWVNVVYGSETEDVLIDNPLQYLGGYIEHPRLAALGVKIKVIEPGEEIQERRDGRGIALQFEKNPKKVRNTEFFDGWFKPLYPRARRFQTPDGQNYMYYGVVVGTLDADTQMLVTLYPEIEEEAVRYTLEDVELP